MAQSAGFQGSFFRKKSRRKNPPIELIDWSSGDYGFYDYGLEPMCECYNADSLSQDAALPPVAWPKIQVYLEELSQDRRKRLDSFVCQYLNRFHYYFNGNWGSYYWGKGVRVVCEDIIRREVDLDEVEIEPFIDYAENYA